jgi:uncharacterized protein (DUF305 family)
MIGFQARQHTTILTATLLLAACGGAGKADPRSSPEPMAGDAAGRSAATRARADSVRRPYTTADVEFMSHMIAHHAQALVMAKWASTRGASSAIRILAERIINGQQDEIATMQRWLRDRGHPAPEPGTSATTQHDNHHPSSDTDLMPGMLTEAQMKELEQARGSEFDRLFLKYMIQHHQGAVTMVSRLFNTPGAARDQSVFKLASDVSADQTSEISRMERMLAETRSPAGT